MRNLIIALLAALQAVAAHGAELSLKKTVPPEEFLKPPLLERQLPQSVVATGGGLIHMAYLAEPTARYAHGVLGDGLEAGRLVVILKDGRKVTFDLPSSRVFEDLQVRLNDLDGDGVDELLVVESDLKLGASLAVYGFDGEKLGKIAATPFIGLPYRWLNPLGVGDFNGDGLKDIALVSTPHIGGILRLYSFTPPNLSEYAKMGGISTHSIGSTSLGMGRVFTMGGKDLIIAPNQAMDALLLVELKDGALKEVARVSLDGVMESELTPLTGKKWGFKLKNGAYYEVAVFPGGGLAEFLKCPQGVFTK